MERYDVAVIGGGLLGCFAARELMRFGITAALIEEREDVCTGVSRANTAIVYSGCDNKPESLKAELTIKANAGFDELCAQLEVPFSRCGALMVSYGGKADEVLRKKLANGIAGGIPELRLISGREAEELEPCLRTGVSTALFSGSTGTVDPWRLCYAAYENAVYNGCSVYLNTRLNAIARDGRGYVLETSEGNFGAAAVINCAGLDSDRVQELLFPPSVRIFPNGADYLVLERGSLPLAHVLLHETQDARKGLTAVPTVEGNVLLGPSERSASSRSCASSKAGMESVRELAKTVLPDFDEEKIIRSFAAVRPNPHRVVYRDEEYVPDGNAIGSFVIERPEEGFMSFIGVKTPGLTCAAELGALAAKTMAEYLGAKPRTDFEPRRRAIKQVRLLSIEARQALTQREPDYGEIVCRCEDISRGEVLEAIARGAVTTDGVKRRCGAMTGVCQGARCQQKIAEILAHELHVPISSVTKSGGGSYLAGGRHG